MTPIHFATQRGFWLLRALGAVVLATVSVAMARAGLASGGLSSPTTWMGIVGLLFFGVGGVVALVQGVRSGPQLTIDDDGVHDRSLGVGVIAWSDIGSAGPYWVARKQFVALDVRDPEKYLARASALKRRLARLNAASGMPPFSVNLVGLDADAGRVAELIMSRRSRAPSRPGAGSSPTSWMARDLYDADDSGDPDEPEPPLLAASPNGRSSSPR